MISLIPIPTTANEAYSIELDGVNIRLWWRWHPRLSRWSVDVFDDKGTPLVEGRCVGLATDLLRGAVGRPPGRIMIARTVPPQRDPPFPWPSDTGIFYVSE